MLFIAYNTILVAYYTRIVALKITSFPIIIICRVRAVGFKMTGLTTAIIKLRSFFKKIISTHIAGKQTEMVF